MIRLSLSYVYSQLHFGQAGKVDVVFSLPRKYKMQSAISPDPHVWHLLFFFPEVFYHLYFPGDPQSCVGSSCNI